MDSYDNNIPVNYTKEAFTHPINLGTLLIATIFGFVAGSLGISTALVLTLICATELMYLGIVPRLPRFRRMMQLKKMSQQQNAADDKALFKSLGEKSKRRYLVLRHLADATKANFKKLPYNSQGLLENIRSKMEALLSNYLVLLDRYKRYELYNNTAHEESLRVEVQQVESELAELDSEPLKKTKRRRVRILKKRLKKFKLAQEKYLVCETHLETIDDAIHFIYEQSMTMNDAKEIGHQLDTLLEEMDETSSIIRDMEHEPLSYQPDADEERLDAELREARANVNQTQKSSQRIKE